MRFTNPVFFIISAAFMMLAACSPTPFTQPPYIGEIMEKCDNTKFENLVGQPKSALEMAGLPKNTRIIGPNTMVTRDYRVDRLNVDIDKNDVIIRFWCG